jgi:hypothetical protein
VGSLRHLQIINHIKVRHCSPMLFYHKKRFGAIAVSGRLQNAHEKVSLEYTWLRVKEGMMVGRKMFVK